MGLEWCYAISLRFVPKILNQNFARNARAHALDQQTLEMEAGNLLSKPRKRISKQAVRCGYFRYYALFYNSLA
ncbi:MAG: hypothetical protein AUH36_00820 [Chloroflexi bacterium 13_1_40CM_55_7]|nr:MAG: hypothetical protein AUH36_00820 [Chloroflexi bacterium 13_1_40CM_55_7]OLD15093.1 MAG: hypothetical protein AUI85_12460 [Acidobacteriales bacterium 13_1_40CM_3_55_5]PYX15149.1 MAG: hypothetical protein DMG84_12730 [Acidobacteriota bacterium]